jgi:hypothetical protein
MANRRNAVKKIVGASLGTALSGYLGVNATGANALGVNALGVNALGVNALGGNMLQPNFFSAGRIRHSVCKWCYGKVPLEEFCKSVKTIGIESVELLGPKEWPVLKQHGLY